MFDLIISTGGIEGVTFTGGEPFEQAPALAELAARVRARGLSVVSYSGYTVEELSQSSCRHVASLLGSLDILVDGRYVASEADALLWRGSRNQKVCFLTDRYKHYQKLTDLQQAVNLELSVSDDSLSLTGNFSQDLVREISKRLERNYGIRWS